MKPLTPSPRASTVPAASEPRPDGSGSGYSSGNLHYRRSPFRHRHSAEILYRLNRMHYLYPRVVNTATLDSMAGAVHSGNSAAFMAAAQTRQTEVTKIIADNKARAAAAAKGKSGSSRSSFGGGRSSGGRSGRW